MQNLPVAVVHTGTAEGSDELGGVDTTRSFCMSTLCRSFNVPSILIVHISPHVAVVLEAYEILQV